MRTEPFRDCQAWRDEGLNLSTSSNEAAKLYDACLSQYVGWYADEQLGGLEKCCEKLQESDPNFALGRAFSFGLQLLGTADSIFTSPSLLEEYESLKTLANPQQDSLEERERLHIKAISCWAEGQPKSACQVWEDLLVSYPTDIHALKMAHDSYFYLGNLPQIRDSVARVLPIWEAKHPPLKSYLYGMYAFGLEENNHYEKAEHYGRKGLEENRMDGWSTHALAHVFEMGGRTKEGIQFMTETQGNWERCNYLACHNFWHTALYHCENEDYDVAAEILDKQLLSRATDSKAILDIVDCASLSWRLKLLSSSSLRKSQWEQAFSITKPYSKHHLTTFNDVHFMMTYTGAGDSAAESSELLETYPTSGGSFSSGDLCNHSTIGKMLLQSFAQYTKSQEGCQEKYSNVVETLEPIRDKIVSIGGSNAQRDVFNLMLIVSALKSRNSRHIKLAKVLINERDALKGKNTKLSQRLRSMAD